MVNRDPETKEKNQVLVNFAPGREPPLFPPERISTDSQFPEPEQIWFLCSTYVRTPHPVYMTKALLLITAALSLLGSSAAVRADPPLPCCPDDPTFPMCLQSQAPCDNFRAHRVKTVTAHDLLPR